MAGGVSMSMGESSPQILRWSRAAWLFLYVMLAFAFWGARPLVDPDEGRYAEGSRGLIEGGGWLVPMIAGEPHLTKPPMTYWLTAAGLEVFGYNAWGARFFLSASFLITILATVELAQVWGMSRSHAQIVGGVFATSALPFISGHLLTTDMFLTAAETVGVLCAWKVLSGGANARWWGLAFWLSFALAFTIKGPPGWMPFIPLVIFWIMRHRGKTSVSGGLLFVGGFLVMLVLSLAWFLILVRRDPSLWQHFVGDEVIARVTSTKFKRNNPAWMYAYVMLLGMAPWVFLWPAFIGKCWKALKTKALRGLNDVELFCFLWVSICLAIFLVSKSRMPLYVVPLTVPFAYWFGRELIMNWMAMLMTRTARVLGAVWMAAMLAFVLYPEQVTPGRTRRTLGIETAKILAASDPQEKLYIIEGTIPYTFSFYSSHVVMRKDIDEKKVQRFLFAERSAGRDVMLVVSIHRAGKIFRKNDGLEANIEVVAKDTKYTVLRLRKDAVLPPPKPKVRKAASPSETP